MASANFDFLKLHDAQLVWLGAQAERYFREDPNTCLHKAAAIAELLAHLAAARAGLFAGPEQSQSDLLRRLKFERVIAGETSELFYQIRIVGNRANHDLGGDYEEQAWAASPPKSSPERNEKNALATWLQTFAWML